MTSSSTFLPMVNTFFPSSWRMSMMYLLRKMMFSSSLSSNLSFLKKVRQALVISPEKLVRSPMMLFVNFFIYSVRSSLALSFSSRMEWKRVPSLISSSPIYYYSIQLYIPYQFKVG